MPAADSPASRLDFALALADAADAVAANAALAGEFLRRLADG